MKIHFDLQAKLLVGMVPCTGTCYKTLNKTAATDGHYLLLRSSIYSKRKEHLKSHNMAVARMPAVGTNYSSFRHWFYMYEHKTPIYRFNSLHCARTVIENVTRR